MKRLCVSFACAALLLPGVVLAKTTGPVLDGMAQTYERQKNEFVSAVIVDAESGKELYVLRPDEPRTAASLTKLMGALTFVDRKPVWTKIVSILKVDEVGGGRLRVASWARLSIKDMLFSSIVGSANNAATALGRISGLGMKGFVAAMNKKAKTLKLSADAHFVDASGMDPENHVTARDMVKIARAAFADPVIGKAAAAVSYSFTIRNTGVAKVIKNTDHLLTNPQGVTVLGSKTGYLEESMNNLVVELQSPTFSKGPPVIVVIMGAPDKEKMFTTARRLAEWAWNAYDWPSVKTAGTATP